MPSEVGHDYEGTRIRARPVVLVACGFALFVAATGAGLTFYYRVRTLGQPLPIPARFPEPRLQIDPAADLAALTSEARARLARLGWADRAAGLVHVPIDAAMRRVVDRGPAGFDPIEGRARLPAPARDGSDRGGEGRSGDAAAARGAAP